MARAAARTTVPIAIVRRLIAERPPKRAAKNNPAATARANANPLAARTRRMSRMVPIKRPRPGILLRLRWPEMGRH